MKTDIQVNEVVRIARRKVFWKLYTLPWVLLSLVLLLGIGAIGWSNFVYRGENNIAIEKVKNLTAEVEGMRVNALRNGSGYWEVSPEGTNRFVYTDKVRGVIPVVTNVIVYTNVVSGDFGILRDELVEVVRMQRGMMEGMARQVSNGNKVVLGMKKVGEDLGKVVGEASGVAKMGARVGAREQGFEGKDWLLAESVGYDLEGELKKGIAGLISYEMKGWDGSISKKELEVKLQNGSQKVIDGAFEGFKTYNRVKR